MSCVDLNNKTILVTGAAGFIGSNLVKRIYADDENVTEDITWTVSDANATVENGYLKTTDVDNFATSIADMEVLGLLSRKISTMFGPIGNMSINTLFNVIPGVDLTKDSPLLERINKIPGIELSNKAYRKFIADIKGNINGDDYVTSFKWIN